MNKLSLLAVIASVSLAAPALAQTPSDIRNGRSTVATSGSSEVSIDHHSSKSAHGSVSGETKDSTEKHHGKKHHAKKHHAGKHHGKKHKTDAKDDVKTESKEGAAK